MKTLILTIMMLCCAAAGMAQSVPDVPTEVATIQELKAEVDKHKDGSTSYANIRLTADVYLSDLPPGTFCSIFSGILDGDGHTIWAAHPEQGHDGGGHYKRGYLFTNAEGATFKNLTFRNIREDNEDWDDQAIIVQIARSGCVFDNITFDNVSVFADDNNVGSVAGTASDCTLSNIKVINSDFTTDANNCGAVVGVANGCTFTNIEVVKCESTTDDDQVGGVVGNANGCTFTDVAVRGSLITNYETRAGGIVGNSHNSTYIRCITDDQSCVCTDDNAETTSIRLVYDEDALRPDRSAASGAPTFSLAGKQVDKSYRGIVIRDGKKVLLGF